MIQTNSNLKNRKAKIIKEEEEGGRGFVVGYQKCDVQY